MLKIVLPLCLLLCLPACDPDRRKRAKEEDLKFSTTDDAELFFKNVRRNSYDHQDIPAAKLDIYRLSERNQAQDHPVLNLAIAHNWRHDEAYLLLEPNEAIGTAPPLHIYWQAKKDSTQAGDYIWEERDKLSQLEFAAKINNALEHGQKLFIVANNGKKLPLLKKPQEREAFKRTMFDYYKLTGTFK